MIKYAKENRIVLMTLSVCFCFALSISSSCKKKEQSEEIGQNVPAEEITHTSTSERIVWVEASDKIDLRILYAGLLETDRAKDFVSFLAAYFEKVETTDYLTFKETESAGFDVTIIDHDGLDSDESKALFKLSHQYTHAAIAVGVPGALICSQISLKTAYL
jgi:hypothetical protein